MKTILAILLFVSISSLGLNVMLVGDLRTIITESKDRLEHLEGAAAVTEGQVLMQSLADYAVSELKLGEWPSNDKLLDLGPFAHSRYYWKFERSSRLPDGNLAIIISRNDRYDLLTATITPEGAVQYLLLGRTPISFRAG